VSNSAPQAPDDATCVANTLRGDSDQFAVLVHRYQARLYALLKMTLRHDSGAEDILQDAWLRAFHNLQKYDSSRPFYPWLATLAVRLAINRLNRTSPPPGMPEEAERLPSPAPGPASRLQLEQSAATLWQLVAQLAWGERTAVLLFYQQDLTVREIAGILDVSTGTVKTYLHRGRAHLQQMLADDANE